MPRSDSQAMTSEAKVNASCLVRCTTIPTLRPMLSP
jgi:hypothetical protein